jgi:diguanylate cyclase (GGDEF)-like protein
MKSQIRPEPSRLSKTFETGQLIAAIAAFVIVGCVMLAYEFVSLRQALVKDVEIEAAIVADNISASVMFEDHDASMETLRAFRPDPSLLSVTGYDRAGFLYAQYLTRNAAPPPEPSAAAFQWLSSTITVHQEIRYRGHQLGVVEFVASTADVRTGILRFAGLLGIASLGAMLVAALVMRRARARMDKAERELDYLAHTDPVTDLANRRATYETLERAMEVHARADRRLALLLIDLDNFKGVNDTAGHGAGDRLLRQVGATLVSVVRKHDVVGRIGGDEFAVIAAPVRDNAEALAIAERITEALRRPFHVDGIDMLATASVGISMFPDDATALTELVSNADIALYQAKVSGKNRLAEFRPEMTLRTQRRVRLERDLRKAMERGELDVYYQPQFRCDSERMVGVEALLRWPHPENGFIAPSEFIPVAEECGLIGELGRWVLLRACSDAASWLRTTGVALNVAVNVSARQLRDGDFIDAVRHALHDTGLAATQLELELTESLLMEDMDSAMEFMHAVRHLGVRLAIDDFGTGYSSLSYLQSFPINQLKIDRSFIQLLPDAGTTIAGAIISLAHGFNLCVVAEGVENRAQLDWLQRAGCDLVQGYLLARPIRAQDISAMLTRKRAQEDAVTS